MTIFLRRPAVQCVRLCALFSFALCAHADPHPRPGEQVGSLPLQFERNTGQADKKILFVTRSGTGLAALMADGVAFRLNDVSGGFTVKMKMKGNPDPDVMPDGEG